MIITPQVLLNAYCKGIFPMAHLDGKIYWYDPNPRAIIPLDSFHVSRSLKRKFRQGLFEIRLDSCFQTVMEACAEPTPERKDTWINAKIIQLYCELHHHGFAHSVETWVEGKLVGGLYGVTVGGLFAGESMFSRATDSSKIALVYLVEHLKAKGFYLLDTQFMTEHLRKFGAIEIPRDEYHARLAKALKVSAKFCNCSPTSTLATDL